MISYKTIFSLLLALLFAGFIMAYTLHLANPCDAYLAGQPSAPSTMVVSPGGRAYQVPCDQWFLRQPQSVQAMCLFEVVIVLVFLVSAFADWQRRRIARPRY